MNILFVHQNFPAQYKHLAPALAKDGHQVVALGRKMVKVDGVKVIPYELLRDYQTPGIHALAQEHEAKVIRGEAVAHTCNELKRKGFTPDVIYVHPGWGEALFLRDVYPDSKIIVYCEYYYNLEGQDVNFDPEFPRLTFEEQCKLRMKNTCNLHAFEIGDAFVAPLKWQRSTYPRRFRRRIRVIHDGVDFESLEAHAPENVVFDTGFRSLTRDDQVITYVARSLEPLRGIHVFLRALVPLLAQFPHLQVLVVGRDELLYGPGPAEETSWKERLVAELGSGLPLDRVHFTGWLDRKAYLDALSLSSVHVYLSYPFVLSWSFIEAIVMCRKVVAARVGPVSEVRASNVDYVDFPHVEKLSDRLEKILTNTGKESRFEPHSSKALKNRFSIEVVLGEQKVLLEQLCGV